MVKRFIDLSLEEVQDLWASAHLISKIIEREYQAEALTLTIQDGPSAGQTVEHVHIHIIPRRKGDWMDNDHIYPEINNKEKALHQELVKGPDAEKDRKPRTKEEMGSETDNLRKLFQSHEDIWT